MRYVFFALLALFALVSDGFGQPNISIDRGMRPLDDTTFWQTTDWGPAIAGLQLRVTARKRLLTPETLFIVPEIKLSSTPPLSTPEKARLDTLIRCGIECRPVDNLDSVWSYVWIGPDLLDQPANLCHQLRLIDTWDSAGTMIWTRDTADSTVLFGKCDAASIVPRQDIEGYRRFPDQYSERFWKYYQSWSAERSYEIRRPHDSGQFVCQVWLSLPFYDARTKWTDILVSKPFVVTILPDSLVPDTIYMCQKVTAFAPGEFVPHDAVYDTLVYHRSASLRIITCHRTKPHLAFQNRNSPHSCFIPNVLDDDFEANDSVLVEQRVMIWELDFGDVCTDHWIEVTCDHEPLVDTSWTTIVYCRH